VGVSKAYPFYSGAADRFWEVALGRESRHRGRVFQALKDVTFSVGVGEAFGVLGRNGAGKSTLLQILAGVLTPTSGAVQVPARVAGLLELGSGFNPEFSGRENIFLNAAILGMSRSEVMARMDDILAFADIGEFIDQPVKTYSSGMFLRLAFSVSTAVDPEVLLVDEALAVGDIFFRQKCYKRLDAMRARGVTILIVSHSIADIRQFCQRALVLHHGRAVFLGPADEAVQHYMQLEQEQQAGAAEVEAASFGAATSNVASNVASNVGSGDGAGAADDAVDRWWTRADVVTFAEQQKVELGPAMITKFLVMDDSGSACTVFEQGQIMRVCVEVNAVRILNTPLFGMALRNDRGVLVHGKNSLLFDILLPRGAAPGTAIRFVQEMTLGVACGEYTLEIGAADVRCDVYEHRGSYSQAELDGLVRKLCHISAVVITVYSRQVPSPCLFSHYGEVDLPGRQTVHIGTMSPG